MSAIEPAEWDALLGDGDDASPFLEHRFLLSLEETNRVCQHTGWIPRIPLLRQNGRLVASAPAYIKLHSQGEFVYDWSWANFAQQQGLPYYPKLMVGVPFTPVTGRRILTAPDTDRPLLIRAMGQALVEIAEAMDLTSVHVNFATDEEVSALEDLGYLHRIQMQYHWQRHGQDCFDDYLGRFKSKRRNQLKRELREAEKQGVRLEVVAGDQLDPGQVFALYRTTIDKFSWGRQYLDEATFKLWAERLSDVMELVVAKDGDGEVLAGAVNFRKGKRLYGRYWGCFAELKHLHFNVCYYQGIQRAFELGLDVFEPGQGGEHKLVRGFEPTLMNSAHFLRDRRLYDPIASHLERERQGVRWERERMLEELSGMGGGTSV